MMLTQHSPGLLHSLLEVQLAASEALFQTDFVAYRAALVQYRQDQEAGADEAEPEEGAG